MAVVVHALNMHIHVTCACTCTIGKNVAKLFSIARRRVAHEAALADNRMEAMRRCVESHVEEGHK